MSKELVMRFTIDVTVDVEREGTRGVERLLDRLCEVGYGKEVTRYRRGGRWWSSMEYRIPCAGFSDLEDAVPYEFSEAERAGELKMRSVRLVTAA